jgi:transposase
LQRMQESEEIIERVAALDIGKAELVCCVRVCDEDKTGRRLQEVTHYSTLTRSLLGMSDRLRALGVTRVVMEATSDYWKAPFYLLEAQGFEVWLVNARDVKHLPGRPKTDRWTRCGCARSPNGRCCDPVLCCRGRSGGCGI